MTGLKTINRGALRRSVRAIIWLANHGAAPAWLGRLAIPLIRNRSWPDFVIEEMQRGAENYFDIDGYMERVWVVRAKPGSNRYACRIHWLLRSDQDRALHNHPWRNTSVILKGGYWELTKIAEPDLGYARQLRWMSLISAIAGDDTCLTSDHIRGLKADGIFWRGVGAIVQRSAEDAHRLILPPGRTSLSLFFTGPKTQDWGFFPEEANYQFVHNDDYFAKNIYSGAGTDHQESNLEDIKSAQTA